MIARAAREGRGTTGDEKISFFVSDDEMSRLEFSSMLLLLLELVELRTAGLELFWRCLFVGITSSSMSSDGAFFFFAETAAAAFGVFFCCKN